MYGTYVWQALSIHSFWFLMFVIIQNWYSIQCYNLGCKSVWNRWKQSRTEKHKVEAINTVWNRWNQSPTDNEKVEVINTVWNRWKQSPTENEKKNKTDKYSLKSATQSPRGNGKSNGSEIKETDSHSRVLFLVGIEIKDFSFFPNKYGDMKFTGYIYCASTPWIWYEITCWRRTSHCKFLHRIINVR